MIPRARAGLRQAAAVLLLCVITPGCFGPPQMGPDREAFKAIDALYTAVSLHEPRMSSGAPVGCRSSARPASCRRRPTTPSPPSSPRRMEACGSSPRRDSARSCSASAASGSKAGET